VVKILEGRPFVARAKHNRYPWKEWVDGQWREINVPKDYPGTAPESITSSIYNYCRRHGYRAELRRDRTTIKFVVKPAPDE
jgi:hypothetical protein